MVCFSFTSYLQSSLNATHCDRPLHTFSHLSLTFNCWADISLESPCKRWETWSSELCRNLPKITWQSQGKSCGLRSDLPGSKSLPLNHDTVLRPTHPPFGDLSSIALILKRPCLPTPRHRGSLWRSQVLYWLLPYSCPRCLTQPLALLPCGDSRSVWWLEWACLTVRLYLPTSKSICMCWIL